MTEERRLAAIMFSDICGFSALMGANEEKAISFVEIHDSLIEDAAAKHSGRVIKKMGDGVLVEFASAVHSVKCALDVQRTVNDYNQQFPAENQIKLRIGIHLGDVVVAGEDILGDGVNIASRIEPLAEPGGICISRDIFDLVRNKIEIETIALGEHDLKNISRKISIYKVLIDAFSGDKTVVQSKPFSINRNALWIAAIVCLGVIGLAAVIVGILNLAKPTATVVTESASSKSVVKEAAAERRSELTTDEDHLKESLIRRQLEYLKLVREVGADAATGLIHPRVIEKLGVGAVEDRIRFFSKESNITELREGDIKVETVEITNEGRLGTVFVDFRRYDPVLGAHKWVRSPGVMWGRHDDEWFMVFADKRGGIRDKKRLPANRRKPDRDRLR